MKCLSKCARCGASLAASIRIEDVVPTRERTAGDIFHLVEQIALNPDVQFFDNGVGRILRQLDRQANSCEDARSVFNSIFPVYWQQMGEEPRLLTFRETRAFSAITGISLFDVLRGNCIGQTRTISYAWSIGTKNQWQAEKRKRQDSDAKKKELSDLLVKTKGTYPSLKSVARSLGVSVGYLNYRFKSNALKIIREHQDHKKREADRKRQTARRAAIQHFARIDAEGGIKSRKGALRELRVSTGLSKGLLRAQIAEIFELRQLKSGAAGIVPQRRQGMQGISGTV